MISCNIHEWGWQARGGLQVGDVKDVSILRDTLGMSKGCAFVTYEELAHAEAAIAKLDKQVKLPGATSNMEVLPSCRLPDF